MLTRHIMGFLVPCNSHLTLIPSHSPSQDTARAVGVGGDVGLQRDIVHDTIKLLNGDVGLGYALSLVLARDTSSLFFVDVF